jgi:DNA-binding NarL/FixJ family response regulator
MKGKKTNRAESVNTENRGGPPEGEKIPQSLSRREREVLTLLLHGCQDKSIAERLNLSISTVREHLKATYRKLNVHSRLEAVAKVRRDGMPLGK